MGQGCRGTLSKTILFLAALKPSSLQLLDRGHRGLRNPAAFSLPRSLTQQLQPGSELCANIQAQPCTFQRVLLLQEQNAPEFSLKL